MKPAALPDTAAVPAAPFLPGDEAQKRAIAKAVWTDLLWLMPSDRTVTIAVTGGDVAVELGPPRRGARGLGPLTPRNASVPLLWRMSPCPIP